MDDTSIGGSPQFPTTDWASVLCSRDERQRQAHLTRLIQRYWKPVYRFVRTQWRRPSEDSKDLTQAFFVDLLERSFIDQADPSRGRFRTFLLACLKNFLRDEHKHRNAAKRGGGLQVCQLDDAMDVETSGDDPFEAFQQAWIRQLLEEALAASEQALEAEGQRLAYDLFRAFAVDADPADRPSYEALALRFGVDRGTVKSRIAHARDRIRKVLMARIREYCGDEREAREELQALCPG